MEQPSIPPVILPQSEQKPAPRRRRWPLIIAGLFIGLILIGSAGFAAASVLEENDQFCISCHTVPEITYFNRAYFALDNPADPVMDLATAHYHQAKTAGGEAFKCIDCHRGDASLGHRIATVALGGRDALIYVAGRENSAIEKINIAEGWLPNAGCVNCHQETLLRLEGINNHFHTKLPQAKDVLAKGGTLTIADAFKEKETELRSEGLGTIDLPILCTSCHLAHRTLQTGATNFFMDADIRNETCISCHLVAKEGPQDIKALSGIQ